MQGPFTAINCAVIPDTLLESLLFGTLKGAFTGAVESPGLFDQASNGTLFLDEINSMSIHLQAKLLRVLQEKNFRRIGDNVQRKLQCRIISSTNKDPMEAIKNQQLREDLYYRIAAVTLYIPSLRERMMEGIRVDKEYIALDAIKRVGPAGHFLGDEHTFAHFRENWKPGITDRNIYDTWAAISALLFNQFKMGDHAIADETSYSATYYLFDNLLRKFGVETTFVDMSDVRNVEKAIKPNTRMIYFESPANITLGMNFLKHQFPIEVTMIPGY